MPHLRALVQRMQGRPFVLLGVNSYDTEEVFRKNAPEFGVTWPVCFQGAETPIAELYRVEGYPTMYVLDQEGRVVVEGLRGDALAAKIEELVTAFEAKR